MVFKKVPKLFFIACFVVGGVLGQGSFIFPGPRSSQSYAPSGGTFAIGSPINIQWDTTASSTDLLMWQNGTLQPQALPNSLGLSSSTKHFVWLIDLSGTNGNPSYELTGLTFFFALFTTGSSNPYALSQNITIIAAPDNPVISNPSTTSTSLSTSRTSSSPSSSDSSTLTSLISTNPPSSTPSSPTTPINSALSNAAPTSTTGATSSSKDGLSSGAKLGIGIGVGVGATAFLAGLAVGYFLYKRKLKAVAPVEPQYTAGDYSPTGVQVTSPDSHVQEYYKSAGLHEIPAGAHANLHEASANSHSDGGTQQRRVYEI